MRDFAVRGDSDKVKTLYRQMWLGTAGIINPMIHEEADHLIMEFALNHGQVDLTKTYLGSIISKWKRISWTSRGGMVALWTEALLGNTKSILTPYLLPQVLASDPIKSVMMPFEAGQPLLGTVKLNEVAMRFFTDSSVPIIDDWGNCIGVLHHDMITHEFYFFLLHLLDLSPQDSTLLSDIVEIGPLPSFTRDDEGTRYAFYILTRQGLRYECSSVSEIQLDSWLAALRTDCKLEKSDATIPNGSC